MAYERPNVILIVCDTLREDLIGVYGGPAKTPNLDKFAKDAMVYENCISPSPWTLPSHVSLFTGLYASKHGIHETNKIKSFGLMDAGKGLSEETIAEHLTKLGYNTLGISNNIMVSRFTGLDKGFGSFFNVEVDLLQSDEAKEAMEMGADPMQIAVNLAKKGDFGKFAKFFKEFVRIQTATLASNYPMNKGGELVNNLLFNSKLDTNFFLFLNLMEMHEPYTKSRGAEKRIIYDALTGIRPVSRNNVESLRKKYIHSIEYLDKNLGVLMDILKSRGLYDNTLIIITSDHGQAFDEHDYMYHGIYLYDEIIRIPLVIKYPNSMKFKKQGGYQSLVNIPNLIKNVINNKDDKALISNCVFSEAFGNDKILPKNYHSRQEYTDKKYEKLRKTVYKDGFKLTVNGSEGTIEEFERSGKRADPKVYKTKFKELLKELKKFTDEDFAFPS